MRQRGGQVDHARGLVNGRALNGCDLVLAKSLAHDIEATGEGRITEATPSPLTRSAASDDAGE